MKEKTQKLIAGALLCLSGATLHAGEYRPQPIETRSAKTVERTTLDGSFRYFTDVKLQEADEFDGWTVDLDLTVPFKDRFQFRIYVPVYTKGDATLTERTINDVVGQDMEIKGWGGVFDFTSVSFEHQLRFAEKSGYDGAYYLGAGTALKPLETDLDSGDKYNHRGRVILFGLKADDQAWSDRVRLLGNLGGRYYWDTDDLYPGGDDQFWALDLKGAAVFQPWGERVHPALEFTYLGDFSGLNQTTLIPQVIVPFGENLEFKGGIPIGLGGDGNQLGATVKLRYGF